MVVENLLSVVAMVENYFRFWRILFHFGFGGSGFQNGGIGGDGFDSIGRASGIAGFGVRGRSRLGGKNY
jgi:hypothetical protein